MNKRPNRDFSKICRICFAKRKLLPMINTSYKGKNIIQLFDFCFAIKIPEDDNLPLNMCEICLNKVYDCYNFKEKCVQAECLLNNLLNECYVTENWETILAKGKAARSTHKAKQNTESEVCDSEFAEESKKLKCVGNRKQTLIRIERPKRVRETKHQDIKIPKHLLMDTREKLFECDTCGQKFSLESNMKRHKMIHTGERPHVCDICGKGFTQLSSLASHKNTHSNDEHLSSNSCFNCKSCGRDFKRYSRYERHLEKHQARNSAKKEPPVSSDQSESFICEVCARVCKSRNRLRTHRLIHGEKLFLCSVCGRAFVTNASLQSHYKTHTGEKPYKCNICGKAFAHVGSFDVHVFTHTGEKPHVCDICNKRFTQLAHLRYHKRTHTGEKPYSCSYCGKSFALKGNLTVHERTHTQETPHVCPECGKGFYDTSSLKKHRKTHEKKNPEEEIPSADIQESVDGQTLIEIIVLDNCDDIITFQ